MVVMYAEFLIFLTALNAVWSKEIKVFDVLVNLLVFLPLYGRIFGWW